MDKDPEASKIEEYKSDKKSGYLLPMSILIAGIIISVAVIYSSGSKNSGNPAALTAQIVPQQNAAADVSGVSGRDVVLGNPNAPVTFVEYADYQCTFCSRFFEQTEPLIIKNYVDTGKVKFIFRNFQFLGPESAAAAEAAECAKDQNKFWQYHDALYGAELADGHENNGNLNRSLFLKLAGDVGLEQKSFAACIDGNKYADQIKKDASDAQAAGVNSTPTFFINGEKILGAQPYENFAAVIDNFLKTK
jgi:protein-disulfide isomerase